MEVFPCTSSSLRCPHIVVIWQRFLPYHVARIRELRNKLTALGSRLTAIEIASQDLTYSFPSCTEGIEHICCFPESVYQTRSASEIHGKVVEVLNDLKPAVIFAPATAFPEGMAAITYRCMSGARVILMDSAWEHTDRRGRLTRVVKRFIHRNVDGLFAPAPSHAGYYMDLGFPMERIVYGSETVDNGYFAFHSDEARRSAVALRQRRRLPENFFLYVGRFLRNKGLDILIQAYQRYYERCPGPPWGLVFVGSGADLDRLSLISQDNARIIFAGSQYGRDLCVYYGLASAFVFPTRSDTWGLALNEAMAAGLPVLVSSSCGAARTLVKEGENGWTFNTREVEILSDLMLRMASLPQGVRAKMGETSRKIIADWSLDRFVAGVLQAMALPRRQQAGLLADFLTRSWHGRVSVN